MTTSCFPATPEGVKALAGHGVVFGLAFSDLMALVAIVMSTGTALWLYRVQTAREERHARVDAAMHRLDNAIDFHREFNSREFAAVRSAAAAFIRRNIRIDWENEDELERFDTETSHAQTSILEIMRFFDRMEAFRSLDRLDLEAAARLLGRDLAWWEGVAFRRMGGRPRSRTLPQIRSLIDEIRTYFGVTDWQGMVERGDQFASKALHGEAPTLTDGM